MTTVKLTTNDRTPQAQKAYLKMTPGGTGAWNDVQFRVNDDCRECDWWVVLEDLPREETVTCPPGHTVFVTGEPATVMRYPDAFLRQFATVITSQGRIKHPDVRHMPTGHIWRPEKNYDELKKIDTVPKTKLLSIITSNKSLTSGHIKRLAFCKRLKEHFSDRADLVGRGINDFADKWDVLAPYKYSIAIENSVEPDYVTEKLTDCFTALTFPFYYGAPNVSDYYSRDAYEPIDINDFEGSVATIEQILADESHYDEHRAALVAAKSSYLNELSLFPLIAKLVEQESRMTANVPKETSIRPRNAFAASTLLDRLKKRLYNAILPL